MSVAGEGEDRSRLAGFELEMVHLVRKGATSKQWREWLRVPLEHAAADENMDLFTRLMDAGADASAGWRGCHGRTLLGAVAKGKNKQMAHALLSVGAWDDVDVKFGEQRESALHVAATYGAEAMSRALMFAGADPNVASGNNHTPLHLAAGEGHDVIVNDLLVNGADPSARTLIYQHTPLHLAAKGGRVSCVSKLLLGGADKDLRTSGEETPLYLAAKRHQLGVVEELLAAKADPDIRANTKCRPLDIAAKWDHVDVVRALLRHGGDINACDDGGQTALHHAVNVDSPHRDNNRSVHVLLEAGADVEAEMAGNGCKTPLHLASACRLSSSGTMCALLDRGANVNARDADGATPLHFACFFSNVGGVELLLRCGADETLVDQEGEAAANDVGRWEQDYHSDAEQRKADDQRIRHMLARAPADRSWRRRGWLVLARSRPDRVQIANDCRSSNSGSSIKVAKASYDGSGATGGGAGEPAMIALRGLVRRVVGLNVEGVFRAVISFL